MLLSNVKNTNNDFRTETYNYVVSKVEQGSGHLCDSELTSIITEIANAFKLVHKLKTNAGDISDGYHTFNELYHHRAILFKVICNTHKHLAWKSKQHHDPNQPMYDNMFIVGIETPEGQATYHYDIDPYWDVFDVKELDRAPEWDGHSPDEAIRRIGLLDK